MMLERNLGTPEARRIIYRIGVHLGDVLIDGDDILGEGVNIAARLESICEPGGVSVSRAVYDQISGKLALGFRTLGLQKLKNIAKPVEVFAIDYLDKADDAHTPDDANVAQMVKYCRAPDGVRLAYAILGQRAAIGEVRKLAEPSGIRLGKPDLAACPSRAVALPYADSLRRERQRHVRLGC
jgi:Adenylate and Guanylate cyclase catalytic domain